MRTKIECPRKHGPEAYYFKRVGTEDEPETVVCCIRCETEEPSPAGRTSKIFSAFVTADTPDGPPQDVLADLWADTCRAAGGTPEPRPDISIEWRPAIGDEHPSGWTVRGRAFPPLLNHAYEVGEGMSGMVCTAMVLLPDGTGDACGKSSEEHRPTEVDA